MSGMVSQPTILRLTQEIIPKVTEGLKQVAKSYSTDKYLCRDCSDVLSFSQIGDFLDGLSNLLHNYPWTLFGDNISRFLSTIKGRVTLHLLSDGFDNIAALDDIDDAGWDEIFSFEFPSPTKLEKEFIALLETWSDEVILFASIQRKEAPIETASPTIWEHGNLISIHWDIAARKARK